MSTHVNTPLSQPSDDFDANTWLGEDALPRITHRDDGWSVYTNHLGWDYPFRTNDPRVWTEDDEVLLDHRDYDTRAFDADSYAALLRARATNGGEFAKPAVQAKLFDYVLLPKRTYDGWFPRGRTHIIAGSSGVGKSRFMWPLLEAQLGGQSYLGHKGAGLDFIAIYADRGKLSNKEMLITMHLEDMADRIDHIPVLWGAAAADAIKDKIEARPEMPAVVFVEGADMLVEDVNSMKHVAPFMSKLNRLAEHYHISLILSLGAGKNKVGNGYKQARDKPFGSSAFARMADSVNVLEFDGDADGDDRVLTVVHRGDKMERFNLRFDEHSGRLFERAVADDRHPVDAVFEDNPDAEYTESDLLAALKESESDVKRSAALARRKVLYDTAKLARRKREDGKYAFKWSKSNPKTIN